jgi:hypothetical protein
MSYKLIRKNDEHWKENLQGLRFTNRLQKAIMDRHNREHHMARIELQKELLERKLSGEKVDLLPSIREAVLVASLKPKSDKIKGIGFNIPSDIINDNFGKCLEKLFRQPTSATNTVTLKDISNTSRECFLYGNAPYTSLWHSNAGSHIQLGSDTGGPARSDYCIGASLGSSPESQVIATGSGTYASGVVSVSAACTAGGSGTVNECGLFGYWYDYAVGYYDFMLAHDLLDSGVAYSATDTLTCVYSINI